MSYDYDEDDVVVNREGGYYGGGIAMPSFVSNVAFAVGKPINKLFYGSRYDDTFSSQNYTTGYWVIGLIVVCLIFMIWGFTWLGISGYANHFGGPPGLPFRGGGQPSTFINSRDAPYFPDVTNDILKREDMEAEAVRALAKINQERVRRASPSDSDPLPWGPFWEEWKQTHGGHENLGYGMEGMMTDAELMKEAI